MRTCTYSFFLFSLFLVGCTLGPNYERPDMELPCEWHSDPQIEVCEEELDNFVWWEQLQDPLLNWLIERAAEQNLDLHIAAARVLAARQEKQAKKADLYPHIDASNTYGHVYFSKDGLYNGLLGGNCCHNKRNVDFFELGFDAEWELDLFGRTRREIAALKAQEEATEETLCDIWVTLSAEIAKNYIQLRAFQERLHVLVQMVDLQAQNVELTKDLLERGQVADIDLNRSENLLSTTKAEMPLIELQIDKAIYHLSILLGYSPGELYDALKEPGCLPAIPTQRPITVPSDLLRRRPDIRYAERQLAAATEKIGAAIAALFPRFTLTGFIGDISTHIGSLFCPASASWIAGPQILLPIFNSQLLMEDVDYNKNMTQKAIYEYQKAVLNALEETEGAIASYHYESKRNALLSEACNSNEHTFQSTLLLYEQGSKDRLSVLTTERDYLSSKDVCIQSHADMLLHYIALYKSLGGTWQVKRDCQE